MMWSGEIQLMAAWRPISFAGLLICAAQSVIAQSILSNRETEIAEIVAHAEPAVVTILADFALTSAENKDPSLFSIFSTKEKYAQGQQYTLVGSGLYIDPRGYIVTRGSIVQDAVDVRVRLWNNDETRAELIGIERRSGLALLKIDSPEIDELPGMQTSGVKLGAWVLVIGNSLGISPAISVGIVTAFHQDGYIQVSANIDPGANGAPVLSASGSVIGIVSGRIAFSEGESRVISAANKVLVAPMERLYSTSRRLLEAYVEQHGWIGITVKRVQYSEVTPQVAEILPGSPAEKAGLEMGDVILKCNQKPFASFYSLKETVKKAKPGDYLTLEVLRGQKKLHIPLQVGKQQIGEIFKRMPFENEYEMTGSFQPRPVSEMSFKAKLQLEGRLRKMEQEIRNLRRRLLKEKR